MLLQIFRFSPCPAKTGKLYNSLFGLYSMMFMRARILVVFVLLCLAIEGAIVGSSPRFVVLVMSEDASKPFVCVLVNSSIYAAIRSSLNQYVKDVEGSGFAVEITETDKLLNETAKGVKAYLQEAFGEGLQGCLFVGDIPEAWFEIGVDLFPIDLYYMDLNGVWVDSDNDTIYDGHSGDVAPEIWVGRLAASTISGDEVSLITNYFDKNHRYRNGSLTLPWWRALLYVDDRETTPLTTYLTQAENDAKLSLSQIFSDITLVRERKTTNASDYKSRLIDPSGYHWLYLMCHGTHDSHTFMVPSQSVDEQQGWYEWDGTVYSSDYRSIDPHVYFYHFFVCSATRYTEPGYLGGSAVFASTYGLLAVGSTTKISTVPVRRFYGSLSDGKCVGVAFQEWFRELIEEYDYKQICFYGLNIVGDPTLGLYHEVHDVAVTDLEVSLNGISGNETLSVTVTVENKGDFLEAFDVTVYYDSFTIFGTADLTLAKGARRTLLFTSSEERFISGFHSRHLIETEATAVLGELDTGDNYRRMYFYGRIVKASSPVIGLSSDIFFGVVFVVLFGIVAIVFLKVVTSERFLRLVSRLNIRS